MKIFGIDFRLSDIIQIILSLVGFIIAIVQVQKTKSSVESSKEATERVLSLMVDRFSINDISEIVPSLREIQTSLRGERFEAASIRVQNVMMIITQLRTRDGYSTEIRLTEIQGMISYLQKFNLLLEERIRDEQISINIPQINSKLAEFMMIFASWLEQEKTKNVEN